MATEAAIDPARLDAFLADSSVPAEAKKAVAEQLRSRAAGANPDIETPQGVAAIEGTRLPAGWKPGQPPVVPTTEGAPATQPEAAGGEPGPVALPIPQEAQAGGPGGLLKRAAGEAFFQTGERPAADINRLGYAIVGKPFYEPERFKAGAIAGGLYGAERLPTEHLKQDLPHRFLEWLGAGAITNPTATAEFFGKQGGGEALGAAASPLEGALLTTPAGRLVWGLGVAARTASGGNDAIADAVEGVGGMTVLGRDLYRLGRLGVRGAKEAGVGLTEAEKAYTAAKGAAKATTAKAEEARGAVEALKTKITESRQQAAAVAAAAEGVARDNISQAVKEHEAAIEHLGHLESQTEVPVAALSAKAGLTAGGPEGQQAGEMLRAIGEDAHKLAPPGVEEVGVPAATKQLASQRRGLYAAREAKADELKAHVPSNPEETSAGAVLIRRRSGQYLRNLIEGTGSHAEKSIAREFATLGIKGLVDPATGALIETKGMTPAAIRDLKKQNPGLQFEYEDIPLSALSKLYARGRTIGMSPREYPTSSNQARRSYSRLMSAVKGSMYAVASGDPELHESFLAADRFVRKVEKPYLQTAAKVLAPGRTERQAFDLLMADDPTTIERIFTHASAPEREAYSHAILSEMMQAVTDETGQIDRVKFAENFSKLPRETQGLLAGFGNGAAKMVVDEALVHSRAIETAKVGVSEKARAVTGVREAERGKRQTLLGAYRLGKAAQVAYLDRQVAEMKAAIKAAAKQQKMAEMFGAVRRRASPNVLAYVRKEEQLPPGKQVSTPSRMFGRQHGMMAVKDMITGNVGWGIIQIGEAYMFLRRGRLVREALETPIDTPRGRELAAALHAVLQWRLGPQFATKAPAGGPRGEIAPATP